MRPRVLVAALAFTLAACATLKTADGGSAYVERELVRDVSFDHQCSPDRIVILRSNADANRPASTYDLDVCGKARRYKRFGSHTGEQWLDVTSLYPSNALSASP